MIIKEVKSETEKITISSSILNNLPDWFGLPESTKEYIEESKSMPFWAAYDDNKAVGFIALKENTHYTCEIYVMGILTEYHRNGIGRSLFKEFYSWAKDHGYEYMQVKTLDPSNPDPYYAKTRKYYASMGFKPFECFPTLWDPFNPCLVMVRSIS